MEQIVLTQAAPKDAADILDITKEAFGLYARAIRKRENVDALHETLDDVLSDINNKHVYLAKIDGETVGSVRFTVLEDGITYLSRFAMRADARDLGIGGLLLEKVRLECMDLGVRAIVLHTASKMRSTVAFYLKNGYYIHSISRDKDYIRALMVNELVEMDELFDYEKYVGSPRD
jgi:GNAT superfamily N-acetyltransferase